MCAKQGLIERAFDLAQSGQYSDVRPLETRLTAEGYEGVRRYLGGRTIRKQLRAAFPQPELVTAASRRPAGTIRPATELRGAVAVITIV